MFNSTQAIRKHFTPTTALTPPPAAVAALKAINENLIQIGTVLIEGGVSPDYLEMVGNQLLAAKFVTEGAILNGWAGGKSNPSTY